jgi:CHAT domain-containing protein
MRSSRGATVGWEAGSSAQLELFSPQTTEDSQYRLKYSPPFRSTMRPPTSDVPLGLTELDPIAASLDQIVTFVDARGRARQAPAAGEALSHMRRVGRQLYDLVVLQDVQADLRADELYIEIGADEKLLDYPWELMHDGKDFLCLKHLVGRFVNLTRPPSLPQKPLRGWSAETLRMLLISVPRPQPRGRTTYDPLLGAEEETRAILETLLPLHSEIEVELLRNPTFNEVYEAIDENRYHIVHFNGHAYFDNHDQYKSSLVLCDRDMTTGHLRNYFAKQPPVFFFMNACETTTTNSATGRWRDRYQIFGLARAFLDTGAYLLGSRWKIGDNGALAFARAFYTLLIKERRSLGTSIRNARVACKEAMPADDLSWASYTFYGDPRLYFPNG